MKKSLSLILAIAMVFSVFASVALAEEQDQEVLDAAAKFEALVEEGIFQGHADGEAGLDENMTRAQAAVVMTELFGLDISNPPASPSFSDVDSSHWAYAQIEAAAKAGIVNGRTNGEFDPGTVAEIEQGVGYVTIQELAIMLTLGFQEIYGLEIDPNGTVNGNVAPWAEQYVAAAIKQGLLPASANFTNYATRAQLVEASYEAFLVIEELPAPGQAAQGIASFDAVGVKKLQVTFNRSVDTKEAKFTVKRNNSDRAIDKVKFSENDTVATLEMNGKLNEGTYTVSVTGVVSDETLTASIELENEKISNIEILNDYAPYSRDSESVVYAWIRVENQYGEDITKANISNLDITAGRGEVVLNGSKDDNRVSIELDRDRDEERRARFDIGQQISLTALDRDTGVFAQKLLEVAPAARVATVEPIEVRHKDDEDKVLNVDSDPADYYVVVEAWDQYGNQVKDEEEAREDISVSVIGRNVIDYAEDNDRNPVFNTVEEEDTSNILVLELAYPNDDEELEAGKAEFIFISRSTGNREVIEVEVSAVGTLDRISFSAPEYAVKTEEVIIPFEAFDQNGEEITDLDAIKKGLGRSEDGSLDRSSRGDISVNGAGLDRHNAIKFRTDYETGAPVIYLDTEGIDARYLNTNESTPVYISAITVTGKTANLNINLRPEARPESISANINVPTALTPGAVVEFKDDNVKVVDQYGREKNIKDFFDDGFKVKIDVANDAYLKGEATLDKDNKTVTLTGDAIGRTNVTLTLEGNVPDRSRRGDLKYDNNIDTRTLSFRTVDPEDLVAYEVGSLANIYTGYVADLDGQTPNPAASEKYGKELEVKGKLSSGTLVAISENEIVSVTTSVYGIRDLGFNKGKYKFFAAEESSGMPEDGKEKEMTVTVTGKLKNGFYNADVDVTLSDADPKLATLSLKGDATVDGIEIKRESPSVVSVKGAGDSIDHAEAVKIVNAIVEAKDQYGVKWDNDLRALDSSKVAFRDNRITVTKVGDSDRWTINAITVNNKRITFDVVIK